jgi:hypothetical protein
MSEKRGAQMYNLKKRKGNENEKIVFNRSSYVEHDAHIC